MEYQIRLAGLEDLERLSDLWAAMVEEARRQVPDLAILPDSRGYFLQFAGVGIASQNAGIYLAKRGSELLGFVLGQIVTPEPPFLPEPYGYVAALYVIPDWRRKGIGGALMRSLTQWLAGRAIRRMELHTYVQNEEAFDFWRSVGFVVLGLRLGAKVIPPLNPRLCRQTKRPE